MTTVTEYINISEEKNSKVVLAVSLFRMTQMQILERRISLDDL